MPLREGHIYSNYPSTFSESLNYWASNSTVLRKYPKWSDWKWAMALSVVFLPFPRMHPMKPCCHFTVLQLLLSPGVSEDICFPESSVPVVIFVCLIGKSTPSVWFLWKMQAAPWKWASPIFCCWFTLLLGIEKVNKAIQAGQAIINALWNKHNSSLLVKMEVTLVT